MAWSKSNVSTSTKKKSELAFMVDVRTQEQWQRLINREGLTLVDVYVEWAGPCYAMTSVLKRIKVEVNDDLLHFATANADRISELAIFTENCRPVFLFIAHGHPVGLLQGANGPMLIRMAHRQMERERNVMAGHAVREVIDIHEAFAKRSQLSERFWDDEEETEEDEVLTNAVDDNLSNRMGDPGEKEQQQPSKNFTLLLMEPYIASDPDLLRTVDECLRAHSLTVMREKQCLVSADDLATFSSGSTVEGDRLRPLTNKLCTVMLVRCEESQRAWALVSSLLGDVAVSLESMNEQMKRRSLRERCYNEEDYNVGFLCPDQKGFLMLMDKFFLEPLTKELSFKANSKSIKSRLLVTKMSVDEETLENCGLLINHVRRVSKVELRREQLSLLSTSDSIKEGVKIFLVSFDALHPKWELMLEKLASSLLFVSSDPKELELFVPDGTRLTGSEPRRQRRQSEQIGGLLKILVDQG